ncbi:drug/metabolite transporter (DMT)-like permease [Tumebacillus sp. BK434]|nr:drug/metabolite transporter (DMT)-like permease [Tumebacillus sp. BK434]
MFFYVLICLIFGTTFLAIKVGIVAGGPPLLFAGLRFSCAGLLVLAFLAWRKHKFPRQTHLYWQMAKVGVCQTTVLFGVMYWAEQYIPSNLAALINAGTPMMVCLLGALQLRQKLHLTQLSGLLLGILGVYLIVGKGTVETSSIVVTAVVIAALSQTVCAWGALETRKLFAAGVSPWVANGFQMLFGSAGLLLAAAVRGESFTEVTDPWGAFGSLLFLIFVGSILGWGLYYLLTAKTSPLLASTWSYVSPVVAMIVGALWMGESFTVLSALGGVIVLAAVAIVNWVDWKKLMQDMQGRKDRSFVS